MITSLFMLSLGGFLLHYLVHPLEKQSYGFLPFFAGLISIIVVTVLFFFKKMIPFAYLLNGMLVIIGTITMAHFSLVKFPLFADIFMLWSAFFTGKALFDLELMNAGNIDSPRHKGRFFRYPNFGFWGVHLAVLSMVYYLGHILWK